MSNTFSSDKKRSQMSCDRQTSWNLSKVFVIILLLITCCSVDVCGGEPERYWRVEGFGNYERGDFGTSDRIEITTVAGRLVYGGEFNGYFGEARMSLPYLHINDIADSHGVNGYRYRDQYFRPKENEDTISGFGDLRLEGELCLFNKYPFYAGTMVNIKLPTADQHSGLGTGEPDLGIGAYVMYIPAEQFLLFGQFSHTFIGDPDGLDYQNTSRFMGSLVFRLSESHSLSLSMETEGSPIPERDGTKILFASWGWKIAEYQFHLTPYWGLNRVAPDSGISVSLSFEF